MSAIELQSTWTCLSCLRKIKRDKKDLKIIKINASCNGLVDAQKGAGIVLLLPKMSVVIMHYIKEKLKSIFAISHLCRKDDLYGAGVSATLVCVSVFYCSWLGFCGHHDYTISQ